jgi:excisionase family DNA binding protein
MTIEKLLTPKEAAAKLRVSMATLRGWRKEGKGPTVVRLSRRTFRYSEEHIKEYIEAVRKAEPGEAWR